LLALARRSSAEAIAPAFERNCPAARASSPRSIANTLRTVIAAMSRKMATGIPRGKRTSHLFVLLRAPDPLSNVDSP
jgi:hypothetical protein